MDEGELVADEMVEVSEIPLSLSLALWFPVVCVVIWFVARLIGGEWLDQQTVVSVVEDEPNLEPAGPHIRAVDPPDALDEDTPLG